MTNSDLLTIDIQQEGIVITLLETSRSALEQLLAEMDTANKDGVKVLGVKVAKGIRPKSSSDDL